MIEDAPRLMKTLTQRKQARGGTVRCSSEDWFSGSAAFPTNSNDAPLLQRGAAHSRILQICHKVSEPDQRGCG